MRQHLLILLLVVFGFRQVHAQTIQYCIPLDSISFFPTILTDYLSDTNSLIISGENHGVKEANDAKILHLYTFLLDHHKISHIVWEAGPSFNWYFQRYLATGDSSLFGNLTHNNKLHTPAFFEALYQQNKITPIQSIGLDLEFWNDFKYPIKCLLFIHSLHPSSSAAMVRTRNTLDSLLSISPDFMEEPIQDLLNEMYRDSAEFKRVLQHDYHSYTQILSCLDQSLPIMKKLFFASQRERYLTGQLQKQVLHPNIQAFAQFGDAHLPTAKFYNPFTRIIQKKRKTPVNIQAIHSLYINCATSYGIFIKYRHSTPHDPLGKNKELKERFIAEKGTWLLLIENDNHTKELIIVTSNFK